MSDEIEELPKKRSRKKFILLLILLVTLLLGIGGYGTFAYLKHMWPFAPESSGVVSSIAGDAAAEQLAALNDVSDQYIRFESAFTFNLPGKTKRGHMVQVEPVLLVHGANNAAIAQQHLPLISATISEICSQQNYESLASPSGRQRFKRVLLDGVRTKLTGVTNEPIVEQILFVNFVMQ